MFEVIIYNGSNRRQNKTLIRCRTSNREKTDLTPIEPLKQVISFEKVAFKGHESFIKSSLKSRELIEVSAIKPIIRQTGRGTDYMTLSTEISGMVKHGSFEYQLPESIVFDKLNNTAKKAIKRTIEAYRKAKVKDVKVCFSYNGNELFNEAFAVGNVYDRVVKSYLYISHI